MALFHGAVAAVENEGVAEIDLSYEDENAEIMVNVTIRREAHQYYLPRSEE